MKKNQKFLHKISVLAIAVIFLFSPHFAKADILINEIMYDLSGADADHEWVEIFNSGLESVDITGWKFFDGSNHNLNQPPENGGQGSLIIPSLGYLILSGNAVTFLADHPGFTLPVIDTVMSLNNTTATLKLINSDSVVVDEVTYDSSKGANGDGNSLQKISSSWSASLPTLGEENKIPAVVDVGSGGGSSGAPLGGSSPSSPAPTVNKDTVAAKPKITEDAKITTKIITKNIAYVGIPVKMQGFGYGYIGEQLSYGKYIWNFGDGDGKEVTNNYPFSHTYFYPGEYTISLEYLLNYYPDNTKIINKFLIKVIPLAISISRVGTEKDFFIELYNNTDYEIDVSEWILSSGLKKFVLPKNTSILSKKKMMLSPKITNFNISDVKFLKLSNNEWYTIFDYNAPVVQSKNTEVSKKSAVLGVTKNTEKIEPKLSAEKEKQKEKEENKKNEEQINQTIEKEDSAPTLLPASSILATSELKNDFIDSNNVIWLASLIFVLSLGSMGVYAIRKRKVVYKNKNDSRKLNANDFDILNE